MSKTVLITGASGGIGKELANRFVKDRYNMVLVARSEGKLEELAKEYREGYGVQVTVYAKDVSLPGVAEEIASDLKKKGITVDYLVNNAGFGLYGEFLETQLEQEMNMIDVNIKALTIMTKLFLPDMVKRCRGGVMNVASVGAFYPGPLMSVYFATKAYVLSFTEALENELSGTAVTVTALCPGPTATGFTGRAGIGIFEAVQKWRHGGRGGGGRSVSRFLTRKDVNYSRSCPPVHNIPAKVATSQGDGSFD